MALKSSIEAFLATRIDSIESLEALLLLFGGGSQSLTTRKTAETIGISQEAAERALLALCESGLAELDGTGFRYAPADPKDASTTAELAREYQSRRAEMINAIYTGNLERLRQFADAFRLRKR
ncbi:MAG: hypothetical protein ACRD16_09945 [Thermoanaerobaculia bacterium]